MNTGIKVAIGLLIVLFACHESKAEDGIRVDKNVTLPLLKNQSAGNEIINKTATKQKTRKVYHCRYEPGKRLSNKTEERICCKFMKNRYYNKWYTGRQYLTTFLDIMKLWNCIELKQQCRERYFDFTPFTKIAYTRVCEPEQYRKQCFSTVSKLALPNTIPHHNNSDTSNISDIQWHGMVDGIKFSKISDKDLQKPCTQVALFEGNRSGYGRYHETVYVFIPYCGFVWCGYDADTLYSRDISLWTCMPQRCRIGIVFTTVIIACLGVATLLGNILVVVVYWYKKRMNNSQSVYRVSLAIGDTLVGVVVFPTFISSFFMLYMTRQSMGNYMKASKNDTLHNESDLQPLRMPSGNYHYSFPRPYVNAIGFFTALSLIISVYTLMLASFDRMAAVCRPLSYNRKKALHIAQYASPILGLVGLVVAVLPIFTGTLRYDLVASILILLTGRDAMIFYTVTMFVPLILVWISTITLFAYSRKHTKVRREISNVSADQITDAEKRLAKTLGIMVGVFSCTLLPAIVTLLVGFGLTNIFYNKPEKLDQTAATTYITFEFLSIVILSSNSLWNCFIYSSRDREFRAITKQILGLTSAKKGMQAMWLSMKNNVSRRMTTTSLTALSSERTKSSNLGEIQDSINHLPADTWPDEESEAIHKNNNGSKGVYNHIEEGNDCQLSDPNKSSGDIYSAVMENIPENIEVETKADTEN